MVIPDDFFPPPFISRRHIHYVIFNGMLVVSASSLQMFIITEVSRLPCAFILTMRYYVGSSVCGANVFCREVVAALSVWH